LYLIHAVTIKWGHRLQCFRSSSRLRNDLYCVEWGR